MEFKTVSEWRVPVKLQSGTVWAGAVIPKKEAAASETSIICEW